MGGALPCKFLRGRALRGKVEDENLQPTQELPKRVVVIRTTSLPQMRFERRYESAHIAIGRPRSRYTGHEDL